MNDFLVYCLNRRSPMSDLKRQTIDPARLPAIVRMKWSPQAMAEGYVPFPKKLIRALPVIFNGPDAIEKLAVVLAIVDYRRPDLSRGPSLEFLAFTAGMEVDVFRRHLKQLEEQKTLTVSGPEAAI